ncbi:pyridoxal-phosphate dependent enzyme [Exilibacterium tricleocarpae]|uniref:L-serine ammonia-lyase n=1 Tax=Exilibacterium tricleocarpae TaxID=2591008 RepID=A0A545SSU4_9GAMM|nr:pyridoxal-phosphate dependent enzyme [Exilibacterium tricleocarpae]TQV68016.1 pyridoxal-phosphate dependent enzyme [Exilibacterium tricleocarpae]
MNKLHIETPLIESLLLNKSDSSEVWLKMEALQPTGSFKIRGIGHACQIYLENGAKAFISSSGGNAGLAVAYSGRRLGVPVTVVVPRTTNQRAIDLIENENAKVRVVGDSWNEAHVFALDLSDKKNAYLHPFDDKHIWEGHASVIDEVYEAGVKPDVVVLSVGGGGLLCGVVEGLRRNKWEDIPVLAIETVGAKSLHTAFKAGKHIGVESISSIATSLGAKKIANRAYQLLSEHNIYSHLVDDTDAIRACNSFLDDHRIMVEPACGASLSAVYDKCDFLKDKKSVLVIVCGGVGVTLGQLKDWSAGACLH